MIRLLMAKRFASPIVFSLFCYYWLAYQLDRQNFTELISCFGLTFFMYYLLTKRSQEKSLNFFIGLGLLFRLVFLFSIPALSDDYYRFIWDGHMLMNGVDPFSLLPSEVGIDFPNKELLFKKMNSPDYYTVYPPLAQTVYWISTWLSPESILGNIIAMRTIIIAFEVGTMYLIIQILRKMKLNTAYGLLYFLNPLVIVELSGNLHFEGIMLFFFLGAVYLIISGNYWKAAIPWALAVATKLIPLFFLPVLLRRESLSRSFFIYLLIGLVFACCWLPFYSENLIPNYLQSIQLYYATFEFNASIYYISRWLSYQMVDYNAIATIGPWLSGIAYVGMFILLVRRKTNEVGVLFTAVLFALTWYYAFALIVHPWYICTLVAFCVFTPYRYAIIWSALIPLSYWTYRSLEYEENYWLIAVEYLAVLSFFIYELLKKESSEARQDKAIQNAK